MTNILLFSSRDSIFLRFRENLFPYLTNQQKRIFFIVSIVFASLTLTTVALCRYCFKKIDIDKKEKVIQAEECLKEEFKIGSIISDWEENLETLRFSDRQIHSAKCFVKIDFEQGEIKKEFIVKKSANASASERDCFLPQAIKIKENIENEMKHLGSFKKMHMYTIFKDHQGHFHGISSYREGLGNDQTRGGGCDMMMETQGLARKMQWIIDNMGFPKEEQIQDGEFLSGALYQALDKPAE